MLGDVLIASARARGLLACWAAGMILLTAAAPKAAALPSGWAYELVSPPDTNGVDVGPGSGSIDGNHAWSTTIVPLLPTQGTGNLTTYAYTRTTKGWKARDLSDPTQPTALAGTVMTGDDSSTAIITRCDFRVVVCAGDVTFDRVTADGTRTHLLTAPPSVPVGAQQPDIVGGSHDLSQVIVQVAANEPHLLAADTHTFGRGVYQSRLGQLAFIGLDENGAVLDCGASVANDPPGSPIGAGFGQDGISDDGGTVVFASPDPLEVAAGDCSGPVDLYVRRGDQTVKISAPPVGVTDEGATYVGSSPDGAVTYFFTATQLVPEDTDGLPDIYKYDLSSGSITRLTPGANVDTGLRPSVQVATDSDTLYFVGLNAIGGQGVDGAQNLYRYHDGTIELVTSTSEGFIFLGQSTRSSFPSPLTPDGNHLVFFSDAPLTGVPTGRTHQLFQYDAVSDSMRCISCRTDGQAPSFEPSLAFGGVNNRIQSDDGSAVVFVTREPLIPQDVNDRRDVYLFHSGAVSLISSGHSRQHSTAFGMSADGDTVFFTTYESLTSDSLQDSLKLYAARRGGGFVRPSETPQCVEDECSGFPAIAPSGGFIATTRFHGLGPSRRVTLREVRIAPSASRSGEKLQVRVRTNHAGVIRFRVQAQFTHRWVRVSATSVRMHHAGTVHVVLPLSPRADTYLRGHHALRVRLVISHSKGATRRLTLRIASPRNGESR